MNQRDDDFVALARAADQSERARLAWERDSDRDPELKRPFDRGERDRLLNAVLPSSALPRRRRHQRFAIALAGGLAAWVAVFAVHRVLEYAAGGPGIPMYTLEVLSPKRTYQVSSLPTYKPVDVVLRPTRPVKNAVSALAFVRMKEGDDVRPLDWEPKVASSGSIRFSGAVDEDVRRHAAALVFVIGSRSSLDKFTVLAANRIGPSWLMNEVGEDVGVRILVQPI